MFYAIVQNYGSMFPVYREATMLYKEGSNPMERLYTIADSIIFQSTYQWFGNAVTPSWWTNVWMNGGVAEYLKHYIMDKVKLQFTNTRISIMLMSTSAKHICADAGEIFLSRYTGNLRTSF
jgi:hypothetical protein